LVALRDLETQPVFWVGTGWLWQAIRSHGRDWPSNPAEYLSAGVVWSTVSLIFSVLEPLECTVLSEHWLKPTRASGREQVVAIATADWHLLGQTRQTGQASTRKKSYGVFGNFWLLFEIWRPRQSFGLGPGGLGRPQGPMGVTGLRIRQNALALEWYGPQSA
jgi:hypothetical protein